jgi:hypothetical protein
LSFTNTTTLDLGGDALPSCVACVMTLPLNPKIDSFAVATITAASSSIRMTEAPGQTILYRECENPSRHGLSPCGPEFLEQCYVFRIPHGRCYTPTANYWLVSTRIARRINPGVALTGLQPASNLVGGTPDVNRDTYANCPTIAMNAGEFGRAN